MPKPYNEYRAAVGVPERPDTSIIKYKYYQYKEGKVLGVHTSDKQITALELKRMFPGLLVEEVVDKVEWDRIWDEIKAKDAEAFQLWLLDLREQYSHLSDRLFDLAYGEAYDRGHSAGYDEVSNYMIDVAVFIERVLEVAKEA